MFFQRVSHLMQRMRDLTVAGKLTWVVENDGWYTATVAEKSISFRMLCYEATNQVGADPRMFQITMPGFNHVFAFGTEGACILFEILGYADVGFRRPPHCRSTIGIH